jgi:hypothetical protein
MMVVPSTGRLRGRPRRGHRPSRCRGSWRCHRQHAVGMPEGAVQAKLAEEVLPNRRRDAIFPLITDWNVCAYSNSKDGYFMREQYSDELAHLREDIVRIPSALAFVGLPRQFRLVVDANEVIGDLLRLAKVYPYSAPRSPLLELNRRRHGSRYCPGLAS